MELMNALCLTAMVFLSLPLPLFASIGMAEFPAARRALMSWALVGSVILAASAAWAVVAPSAAWIAMTVGAMAFLVCAMHMVQYLARAAAQAERAGLPRVTD